jgi:hypothetical protein
MEGRLSSRPGFGLSSSGGWKAATPSHGRVAKKGSAIPKVRVVARLQNGQLAERETRVLSCCHELRNYYERKTHLVREREHEFIAT